MPVPWNDDDPRDLAVIEQNLRSVLRQIVERAPRREPPTVAMAQSWHRRIYRDVPLPVPYYAGGVRGGDPGLPELFGYEVAVGSIPGVASLHVPRQLEAFERFMRQAVGRLDPRISVGERPATSAGRSGARWCGRTVPSSASGRPGRKEGSRDTTAIASPWCSKMRPSTFAS